MAALKYSSLYDKIYPYKTIREVVEKVIKGTIDRGIIPLENSQEGSVNISLDLLLKKTDLLISGEVIIPIEHFLLASPGVEMKDIKEIYSHPQAIAQSGDFVYNNLPEVELNYTDSTASAAKIVKGSNNKAMIGSRRITEIHNLNILAKNIEGELNNHTRFIVVGQKSDIKKEKIKKDKNYKTSIICTPEINRPGVLHEILGEFASRNIDLTRIESRPTKKRLGEYLFYIDLEGHQNDPGLSKALKKVKKMSGFFKILGSYPREKIKYKESEGNDGKNKVAR